MSPSARKASGSIPRIASATRLYRQRRSCSDGRDLQAMSPTAAITGAPPCSASEGGRSAQEAATTRRSSASPSDRRIVPPPPAERIAPPGLNRVNAARQTSRDRRSGLEFRAGPFLVAVALLAPGVG